MIGRLNESLSNLPDEEQPPALDAIGPTTEEYGGDDKALDEFRGEEAGDLPSLPDAFEASFLEVHRSEMMEEAAPPGASRAVDDTRVYPFRAIAFLHIYARDGSEWRGTGFLVSPRTLITAGHNVFLPKRGGWAALIELHPGRNAAGSPFGKFKSVKFRSVRGWIEGRDPAYDYGAIILDADIGTRLGFFGLHEPTDEELRQFVLDLSGYPNREAEQIEGRGRTRDADDRRIFYDIPTAIGQSGSAVWFADRRPHAVGVHGYESGSLNSGVRLHPKVHEQMRAWRV